MQFLASLGNRSLNREMLWVHDLIARQSVARPQALAVRDQHRELTFLELDRRANRLARYIQRLGVGTEVPVGLYFRRSADFVVGSLAVLKAGGGYVPLDSANPSERIATILSDAGVSVLLTHRDMTAGLPTLGWKTVDLDRDCANIEAQSAEPFSEPRIGHELAYVIYTSGSTGSPKGVEVTHANLAHLVRWYKDAVKVNENDRASQMFGFAFDAAVLEIWGHLSAGASLHLVDEVSRRSAEGLRDWFVAQRTTIAFVPAMMAEHLISFDWPFQTELRLLVTGGDTLHRYPRADLPFVVQNQYGPTECTVLATAGMIGTGSVEAHLPSIGRPIDNTEVLILDVDLNPLPAGEEGEICIAGPQVTRGYRHLPELTAEKFVTEPAQGRRIYRTGDLGRVLPSGEIAFLGRMDDLIKIRGFRVEPDEIVAHLLLHPRISESTVVAYGEHAHEKLLVAYLVPADGVQLLAAELKEYLRTRMPDYMIPTSFVSLSSLPLTTSGKCDKQSLPPPSPANVLPESHDSLPVGNPSFGSKTETRIAELVSRLLGGRMLGRHDDLLLAGGHSMLAAHLLARLRESFCVNLTLRQVFQRPTISALAELVDQQIAK